MTMYIICKQYAVLKDRLLANLCHSGQFAQLEASRPKADTDWAKENPPKWAKNKTELI